MMSVRVSPPSRGLWAAAALLAVVSCGDPTGSDRPGDLASIGVVSGDLQTATVGTELPEPLVVRATDDRGRPIPGLVVNFRVTAGNGSVFAGSAQTDTAGLARERWTLGTSTADTQRVEVRATDPATGVPRTYATFRAVAGAGNPASIAPVGPTSFTGTVGQQLADSLAAVVRDQYGNPVPGAAVVWTARSGGGSLSPNTTTTGPNGVARSAWTLGTRVDSVQVAEAAAGLTLKTTFTATAAPGFGLTLVKRAGDNQTGPVGEKLPIPVRVAVLLPDGRPVVGATVYWSPSRGGATGAVRNTTDENGESWAEWVPGTTPGVKTIVAGLAGGPAVTFTATVVAGVPHSLNVTGNSQTGPEGAPLPDSVVVFVRDRYGNANPGVTVTWEVAQGGGSASPTTVLTDERGRAATQWTLGSPGPQRLRVTVAGGLTALLDANATPVVTIPVERTISAWNSTCAVTSGGALYCWGANGSGQVGDGTLVSRPTPVRIRPDLAFASVSVGAEHACAVTTSGMVYCWGNNAYGQLGDGTTQTRFTPAPVAAPVAFTRVAAGSLHTCALATTGAAYCWGGNQYGQMGIGSPTPRSSTTPVAVAGGRTYTSIDAGSDQSCAVATSGEGYCWGAYEYGRTGTTAGPGANCGGIFCVPAPAPVAGGHSWRVISAGVRPTCGVTTADQAYCWGDIPPAGFTSYTGYQGTTPMAVQGGIAFRTVSAGDRHACGIGTTGAAWCWGTNNAGQLGTGPGAPSNNQPVNGPTPQPVLGGLTFAVLAAGVDHTCGITTGGAAWCWGANGSGQLGTGTSTPSPVPAPVAGGITFLRARAR